MNNKAIYDKHFTRVYYFVYHYLKDNDKASDTAIEAFVALFSCFDDENEEGIKQFLYNYVTSACAEYYTDTLGLAPPDAEDFFNTRLDAEFLYLKYQEMEYP